MDVRPGDKLLLVWSGCSEESLLSAVQDLKNSVGANGDVSLENAERLEFGRNSSILKCHKPCTSQISKQLYICLLFPYKGAQGASIYSAVLAGVIPPCSLIHSDDMLEEMVRIVQPGGRLLLREPTCPIGMMRPKV